MTKTLIVSLFTTFFSIVSFACTVDVTILEGSSVSFCQETGGTIHASPGFLAYAWTGPQTGGTATLTPTVSGQYVVTAVDGVGCISTDTITVIIYTSPSGIISSSEGLTLCPGSAGSTLSISPAFSSYLWNNGSSAPTILVNQGGTYSCQFVDGNGCVGNASIQLTAPTFSLNASTTSVCNGSPATLIASGGGSYSWSTGETGATIVVSPTLTTTYSVTIINGSCTQTLIQQIQTLTIQSQEITDTFYMQPGDLITMIAPDNFESYSWTPVTNLSYFDSQNATYSGDQSIIFTVNSMNSNGCMRSDNIWVFVIRLTIPTGFSPNSDSKNDLFLIPELDAYNNAHLIVFNRWGNKVFETDDYQNDWDGTCQGNACLGNGILPEGTYFYSLDVNGQHFDGYTTLKL
jgi:gliding motility-associated-like protein